MSIYEAIQNLYNLIDSLEHIKAIDDDKASEAYDSLTEICKYVRSNKGGSSND